MARPRKRVNNYQGRAHLAVAAAVRTGVLLPVAARVCADCGQSATGYHHERGYDAGYELDVIPLCSRCHASHPHPVDRGRANPRLTIVAYPDDAELIHRLRLAALAAKTPLREWLLEAGRQRLERVGDTNDSNAFAAGTHD